MTNRRRKVLVFGATGEIGSRVARGCIEAGYETTGVSRGKNTRDRVSTEDVAFIAGDKGDRGFFESTLSRREFDTIIDTVPTTEHVALAHEYFNGRIEHYFMCSSTGTFVPLRYLPADENHPWREETGVNFYEQCMRDDYALSLWREHGFPVTILRPTNIIGPGRVPLELWGGRNPLYYRLMRQGKPIEIPVAGNTLIQSGYNDDLATAFVDAIAKGSEIAGEVFIISCKSAITLDRYFGIAREVLRSASPVEYVSIQEVLHRHPGEASEAGLRFLAEHMCFDIGKAEEVLGYCPKRSTEQGLTKALEWCLDQGLFG